MIKVALFALGLLAAAATMAAVYVRYVNGEGRQEEMENRQNELLPCYDEAVEEVRYLDYYTETIGEMTEAKNIEVDVILAKILYQM